ncbi:ankyrin repeat-containing domain protein [Lyophyllum atratum]|nr:ankyrin repeat-containing domain protein [Lyophyllum atratum]
MEYFLGLLAFGLFTWYKKSSVEPVAHMWPPPGYPPLLKAVINRDLEAARHLLANGADVHVKTKSDPSYLPAGYMPIHFAGMSGDVNMLLLLLDHGADVGKITDGYGDRPSPLVEAVATDHEGAAKLLMERGAVTGRPQLTEYGMSNYIRWMSDHHFILYQQSLAGAQRTTGFLSNLWTWLTQKPLGPLQRQPPPGFETPPLVLAVIARNLEAAKFLLEQGADVNAMDHAGYQLLHYAALAGDADMLSLLLDHGADIGVAAGRPPKSALAHAISSKNESAAKVLMSRSATTGHNELTLFEMASYIRWIPDVRKLSTKSYAAKA